jgi:hypothetical protein
VDLTFDIVPDTHQSQQDMYALDVAETGTECGHAVKRAHRIPFNATTGSYDVPDALMREGCLESP